jgi:hypothetical protein
MPHQQPVEAPVKPHTVQPTLHAAQCAGIAMGHGFGMWCAVSAVAHTPSTLHPLGLGLNRAFSRKP